jgi:hypothetical protein
MMVIVAYYFSSMYSLYLRNEITTTITPSPVYVSKLYAFMRYQYFAGEDIPSTEGWIWYQIRLSSPPEGKKYFLLTNLSKDNFNTYVWDCDLCSWTREYVCYEDYCDYEDVCREVNFERLNSTHSYAFTKYDFFYGIYIEVIFSPEEWDAVSNAWLVIVLVDENETLEHLMSNLYIA